MVRLKVREKKFLKAMFLFQFHNGTIKSSQSDNTVTDSQLFQFHNGTIKRLTFKLKMEFTNQFQFHNGTIKSEMKSFILYFLL